MGKDELSDTALLMVKPDGVRQGLTGEIVGWMERRDYHAVAFRQLALTPQRRVAIYGRPDRPRHLDWALNGILYTLAPVHAIVVRRLSRGTSGDTASHELSRRLKGHFIPNRASVGTIRRDLGALNPIFNLVHASDESADVLADVRVLFGANLQELGGRPLGAFELRRPTVPDRLDLWRSVAAGLHADSGIDLKGLSELGQRDVSDAALGTAAAILDEVAPKCGTAVARRLDAIRTGELPFDQYATSVPDVWARYLSYTTLRYLDLCARFPPADTREPARGPGDPGER